MNERPPRIETISIDTGASGIVAQLTWTGAAVAMLAFPTVSRAAPAFTLPIGLDPGDHYRIAFVTTNIISATSTSIATYNSFVTTDAALNPLLPASTWTAIGSVAGTNAIDNIACSPSCASDPIYLVDGTKVASSSTTGSGGLFSGALLHAINITESGITAPGPSNYLWTGTTPTGVADTAGSQGGGFGGPLGSDRPTSGDFNSTTSTAFDDGAGLAPNPQQMYAISGDLVVPTPTPEPDAVSLLTLGGLLTFAARTFQRRQPRAI